MAEKCKLREKLVAFYKIHNPDKVEVVPDIMISYAGFEDVLFAQLKHKYGSTPDDVPEDADEWVILPEKVHYRK